MDLTNQPQHESHELGKVVDLLTAEQEVLERARAVSQRIVKRVHELAGDTQAGRSRSEFDPDQSESRFS